MTMTDSLPLKYDVYLAGAMVGKRVGDVLSSRARAKHFCNLNNVTYYDPAESEGLESLPLDSIISLNCDIQQMQEFVQKDERNLIQCRMLLNLTGDINSSGVGWEMPLMKQLKRLIILVAPKMFRGELVNFTTVKATKIFDTQEAAISWIANELKYGEEYYALCT